MQKAGYIPVATFILPENCRTVNYHEPQKSIQEAFLNKYKGNKAAEDLVAFQMHEYSKLPPSQHFNQEKV